MLSSFNPKQFFLLGSALLLLTACTGWGTASVPRSTDVSGSSSTSSTTSSNDDFGACKSDVALLCSGFNTGDWQTWATTNGYTTASWKLGLVDCLGENRDKTSQTCDDSLDRRAALNEDLNTACATDRGLYCKGVVPVPGSEPQVDCLKQNYCKVQNTCAVAVDLHEKAKADAQQDFSYQDCQ